MANPVQALNENFFYNSMLARALLQLLPVDARGSVRQWLEKLHCMDGEPETLILRNDYMWFLLLMLQNKKIKVPFNKDPPSELKPLRDILPQKVYEEVLTATDQNTSWLDQMGGDDNETSKFNTVMSSPPAEFLDNQPIPKEGIVCYIAAFSDHDY